MTSKTTYITVAKTIWWLQHRGDTFTQPLSYGRSLVMFRQGKYLSMCRKKTASKVTGMAEVSQSCYFMRGWAVVVWNRFSGWYSSSNKNMMETWSDRDEGYDKTDRSERVVQRSGARSKVLEALFMYKLIEDTRWLLMTQPHWGGQMHYLDEYYLQ